LDGGPSNIKNLHQFFGYKSSTLTSILDRLEKKRLLKRSLDPNDRRSFKIHLTKKGQKIAKSIHYEMHCLETILKKNMNSRDLDGFWRVLSVIDQAIGNPESYDLSNPNQ